MFFHNSLSIIFNLCFFTGVCVVNKYQKCYMVNCTSPNNVPYHNFPTDPLRANEWLKICKKVKVPKTAKVCGLHFTKASYKRSYVEESTGHSGKKRLKCDSVPYQPFISPPPFTAPLSQSKSIQCRKLKNWRPELLSAKKKMAALQTKMKRMKHVTKTDEKQIVKKYLTNLGHSTTWVKHIMSPNLSSRKKYTKDDISTGLVLKNIRNF